ncbi:zinc finger protein 260-like [Watersipora subatra]|uniref:zinc finger protein 260-like n=1 Tax=Watersipora subatra TaxID=2589382 RepID=UPI00355B84B7
MALLHLKPLAQTCVEAARVMDYTGVVFFYHKESQHVIVDWTERDMEKEFRTLAEDTLGRFFKDKLSFLAMAAKIKQDEENSEVDIVGDGQSATAAVNGPNIQVKVECDEQQLCPTTGEMIEKSDAGAHNYHGALTTGNDEALDMSNAGIGERMSFKESSGTQTDDGTFRRSARLSQPRVTFEWDSGSEHSPENTKEDDENNMEDWTGLHMEEYLSSMPKQKAASKHKGRRGRKGVGNRKTTASTSQARDQSDARERSDGDETLYCETCGKCFRNPYLLKMHARTHTGERPFQCATCGKTFAQEGNLKTHSFIHTGVKPFPCTECEKRFSQKVHLKNHMLVHTGEKPHQCEVCGRTFSRPKTLAVHRLSHSDGQIHQCNSCEKSFTARSLLREHQMVHLDKVHECSECKKRFSCGTHLRRHILTHSGFKGFQCEVCNKTFTQNSSLKRHVLLHTGSDVKHACEVCGKEFLWKSSWLSHKLTHLKS